MQHPYLELHVLRGSLIKNKTLNNINKKQQLRVVGTIKSTASLINQIQKIDF